MKVNQSNPVNIAVEAAAYEGVKRIAEKVATDFEKVVGVTPIISECITEDVTIIFATLGRSAFVDGLILAGKFDKASIDGKNEVYAIQLIDDQLVIIGSDKRGTIYGMFALSEYIGVSPLHFWGDAEPERRTEIVINADVSIVSKEPSVKYRGFFINDEWPCFGNWTFNHFGGFTAKMYEHVFELLLRLKGNYLWPAMWTSSFPVDGPGNLNEELADLYGVVMGASHHEPMLRASEEWDIYRGTDTQYGNNWCYYTNKDGLNRYWEDGIKRSGKYEKITMLGMRGERDSEILGEDATLKDNIDLLKDVITNQRDLLKKYGNPHNPEMLAIYKEVEEYFYGDETTEGLKDWAGLDDVICMFCEDNFGFVRTLPTADLGNRRYGMYYHFDYHGGPISYEWMPSTTYERTWEQLSMAYDYGVRDVWIVNVGDLKFNEVPLQYFMDLAYDFEKWGTHSPNAITTYTNQWVQKTFPTVDSKTHLQMGDVLQGYIRMNAMRRPEALNASIYHPAHHLEADRMLALATTLEAVNEDIFTRLTGQTKEAYYSMIWLPATASINLLRMHLYSAKNQHYANQGKKVANAYADLVKKAIDYDRELFKTLSEFKNGKWRGMELEEHIGFTTWNDDGYKYPLRVTVEPAHKPRLVVSRKDHATICHKTYGAPMTITVDDFLSAGTDTVVLEVANDGVGSLDYTIEGNATDWLTISAPIGTVEAQEEVVLMCDRSKLTEAVQQVRLLIKDAETVVAVDIKAKADPTGLPVLTHLPNRGVVVMKAHHFCHQKEVGLARFVHLAHYGRSGSGMKVYPTTVNFNEADDKPALTYRFLAEVTGDYVVEVWTTPTNPLRNQTPLRFMIEAKGNDSQAITAVPADFVPFHTDPRWCAGVLDNIRQTKVTLTFESGVQELTIGALEAGLIVEKVLVYQKDQAPEPSYLGPQESVVTT
ncbi:MAG: glycosyl hydrolase 115 family protein [Defluviitaleaceae bacterium]|nr:glycosyl hydrolase 115 family protein [Defluviitaleaceae bacterium]